LELRDLGRIDGEVREHEFEMGESSWGIRVLVITGLAIIMS